MLQSGQVYTIEHCKRRRAEIEYLSQESQPCQILDTILNKSGAGGNTNYEVFETMAIKIMKVQK